MQTHCRSVLLFLWAVMLSLLVLSCGGGGGNSTAPPTNPPPVDWEDPTGDPTDNDYELDLDPRAVLNHEPECDTAWARGTERVRPFGNWATYFTMPREDGSVTKQLYAGRTNLVGELFVEIEDDTLTVTYDLERQMEGAKLLKCSEFGQAIVSNM